eukprot:COSAG02_NODE_2151_length_9656_cov_5.628754_6_plen_42_part_01
MIFGHCMTLISVPRYAFSYVACILRPCMCGAVTAMYLVFNAI